MSDNEPAAADGESGPADEKPAKSGLISTLIGFAVATLIAGGAGVGLGIVLAGAIETAVMAKVNAIPERPPAPSVKYSGDLVLRNLEPVIVNLAAPADTWMRIEAAIVFENGAIDNPEVTSAEIGQDIMAYGRTISLDQLRGPSALQHLRDDLNERVAVRTGKAVRELVIKSMVVQ